MAILKALTRHQLQIMEHGDKRLGVKAPREPIQPKAEWTCAERLDNQRMIETYTGEITVGKAGKPLKMWRHWQADYRSFTPRGAMTARDAAKYAADKARANGALPRWEGSNKIVFPS